MMTELVEWIDGRDRLGDIRMFCFPHAGAGGRVFRPWIGTLGPDIAVCPVLLPAREQRWREPAATTMAEVVDPLYRTILAWDERPYALFGHSLGAGIAHALAVRLHQTPGAPQPKHLFVSGRPAPWLRARMPSSTTMSDEEFTVRLKSLDGTPAEILTDPGMLAALLPVLRADFAVSESYRAVDAPRLSIPVTVFGGQADPLAEPDELLAWREATGGPFALKIFPGGHFFLTESPEPILDAVRSALSR
jgi:medium-chain acyl-[acyl-carrier-protein] hydrolase